MNQKQDLFIDYILCDKYYQTLQEKFGNICYKSYKTKTYIIKLINIYLTVLRELCIYQKYL